MEYFKVVGERLKKKRVYLPLLVALGSVFGVSVSPEAQVALSVIF